MSLFAKQIIRTLGRPARYAEPGSVDWVDCRAVITDADQEMRFHRGSQAIGSDAAGTVLSSISPRKGGRIATLSGAEYEIYGIIPGDVPGLLELALMRLTEAAADPIFDFSAPVLRHLGEDLTIDGLPVRCSVNRSGLFEEEDAWGNRIEVTRVVVAFRASDAPDVDEGSIVLIDGEEHPITRLMRDGSGLVQGVL